MIIFLQWYMLIIKNMSVKWFEEKSFVSIIWLIFSIIYSTHILNLYYLSTRSPDYSRYSKYLEYFSSEVEVINLEQGLAYFFVIFLTKVTLYNVITFSQLEEFYTFNDYEHFISLAIQTGNTHLYLIGLVGLYFLLIYLLPGQSNTVLLVLGLINFLPQSIYLRGTMKPEVLAFAIFPWIILAFQKYVDSKKLYYLFTTIPALVLISTTKASIAAMVVIILLVLYSKEVLKLNIKNIIFITLIFAFIFSLVSFENFSATNRSILSRGDLQIEYDQLNYDYKADVSFLYNFSPKVMLENPFRDSQSSSWIGIVLSDTFDDYFNLYNNLDYSLLKNSRKGFIQTGDSLSFNSISEILTIPFGFNLDYARRYLAILLTASFYLLLLKNRNNQKLFKLSILPIFGILVLLVNSFGIPENNFDPDVGDTLKTFYYSFLFITSFSVLGSSLLSKIKNNFLKGGVVLFFSILFLFILGFPKANNDFFDFSLNEHNAKTYTCKINKPILEISSINNSEKKCRTSVNNFCSAYYSIENNLNSNNSSVDLINIENIKLESTVYKDNLKLNVVNYRQCEEAYFLGYRLKKASQLNVPYVNILLFMLFLISNLFTLKRTEKSL